MIGRPPAEADLQRHFRVTPPSVHQMILSLERAGLIRRRPRLARSIELLIDPERLPPLRVQAANTGADANLDSYKAADAMASLPYGIGSSLLGGASSIVRGWPSGMAGSTYNLGNDLLRTAGDRDLNGYN